MNQYIEIDYKPDWSLNYWSIWFHLDNKGHREMAPSWSDSTGYWSWWVYDEYEKHGYDFDWSKE